MWVQFGFFVEVDTDEENGGILKVLILAGGFGTRLTEETVARPKPMVSVGEHPILWHIMKTYSHHGYNDFVVLLGYKGYMIKEYFANFFLHSSDVTIDLKNNDVQVHRNNCEPWKVTLVDTGPKTNTGGRVKRVQHHVGDEPFLLTYGDGIGDVDISSLVEFHKSHGKLLSITSVIPEGRFGSLDFDTQNSVVEFVEKPTWTESWINAGFFVCQPEVFEHIPDDTTASFEKDTLAVLAQRGEIMGYKHSGFWRPMDTLRDKIILSDLWNSGQAPWKKW